MIEMRLFQYLKIFLKEKGLNDKNKNESYVTHV